MNQLGLAAEAQSDLMNRLMTKSWQDYAQVSHSLKSSPEESPSPVGMSDAEELRRWAQAQGLGEISEEEYDDDRELLGLRDFFGKE